MLKIFLTVIFLWSCEFILGQTILNGDFEMHTVTTDQINLTNNQYNSIMSNSFAFGNCNITSGNGDMDIITTNTYCGLLAQSGSWYVALTGGGSDAISLTLSSPLIAGNTYTLSFYDYFCNLSNYLTFPVQIGLSTTNNNFGTVIYTSPAAPSATWNQRIFTFTAPNNGQFITIQISGGQCSDTWIQVDNFTMDCATNVSLGNDTTLCSGQSLTLNAFNPNSTYLWSDNSTLFAMTVSVPGTYWVEVTTPCGIAQDTITINTISSPSVNLGNDTAFCTVSLTLNASQPNSIYQWQDNSTDSTYFVTLPGSYWVCVTNNCGSVTDSISISLIAPLSLNLGNDTSVCNGNILTLNATSAGASYLWQDNSTNPFYSVTVTGMYVVQLTNYCGSIFDSINVTFNYPPVPFLGNDTILCSGNSMLLNTSTSGTSYLWQDNSTNINFLVNQPGIYWVQVTNNCGTNTDSINVEFEVLPVVSLGPDTILCQGQTITLQSNNPVALITWQDNSTSQNYHVTQQGVYWVEVSTNCGNVTDTVIVNYNPFSNSGIIKDTALCDGTSAMLSENIPGATYLWQDNSTGRDYLAIQSGLYWVKIAVDNCSRTDTFNVRSIPMPDVNLGDDSVLCLGEIQVLDATTTDATYLWNDGSTSALFSVTGEGIFSVQVSIEGCTDVFSITIKSINQDCKCVLYVPNSFTPNNDGLNEMFHGFTDCTFSQYQFYIFDRWGEIIYSTINSYDAWDGTYLGNLAPDGVYVYLINYLFENEISSKTRHGKVTLIR